MIEAIDSPDREIILHLDRWRRWYRLRRAVTWGIHGLAVLLTIGLAVGAVMLFSARWLPSEFAVFLAAAAFTGLIGGGILGYAWRFPQREAARFFDLQFRLKERVSTALELIGEPQILDNVGSKYGGPPGDGLVARQIEDAASAARRINPRLSLPLRLQLPEILFIFALGIAALLSVRLARPATQAALQQRAVEAAIEAETARLEELVSQIEANPDLSEQQRQALTAALEKASAELQGTRTREEALAVLDSAEGELQKLENPDNQTKAHDLRVAGEQLTRADQEAADSALQPFGEALSAGDFEAAAQALRQLEIKESPPETTEAQATQLEEAADALRDSNPELAQALQEAAQALRAGDAQAAQQAIQQAAQIMDRTGQAIAGSEAASQTADQIQASQQRLAQAGDSGSQANSQGGQEAGSGGPDAGSGQAGQGSQAGGGSGRGEGQGQESAGAEVGADPIDQGNGPGDGGLRLYDQVYSPQRVGGSGGQEVGLPGSGQPGDQTVGQGSPQPGLSGTSQVPYTDVYSSYAVDYYRALSSGQVPAYLRDYVRRYFSSLSPK